MANPTVVDFGQPARGETEPRIVTRVSRFARVLRDNGFLVGLQETSDALQGLAGIDILDKREMRCVLRCALSSNKRDWVKFDKLFDAYWLGRGARRSRIASSGAMQTRTRERDSGGQTSRPSSPIEDYLKRIKGGGNDGAETASGEGRHAGASAAENIADVDIARIVEPERMDELVDLAERLAARIRFRLSRRRRLDRRGRQIDIRRTLHSSVSTGGTPIRLFRRRRRKKPFKLVIFLDVSGSMDQYSRFFMRFIHLLLGAFRSADAFIFHTRLVEVSTVLKERNPEKMMERLALIVQGWSGGTRIGESLAIFNRDHARRVMTSRTLVMIVSDGFDTGAPEKLAGEMARLQRRAKRIIWLNPLLGSQGYEPRSAGMAAALPYIDLFAPAHNLSSLAALEPELARI